MKQIASICAVILGSAMLLISCVPMTAAEYIVGWQDPILAEDYNVSSVYDPETSTDGKGNVMAVWLQGNGSGYNVHACLHTAGGGWQESELIEHGDAQVMDPFVAMNDAGDAVAAWSQRNETTMYWDIWGNVYIDGVGWTGAKELSSGGMLEDRYPDLVVDGEGNAVVVWSHLDAVSSIVMASYSVGTGWSSPVTIVAVDMVDALYPSIGIDEDGNMLVTWVQYEMSAPSIWAMRYDVVDGWSAPEKIGDSGMYGMPVLAVNADGDAICAWSHDNASTTYVEVWSCTYASGTGWNAPLLSGHSSSSDHEDPQVAIDGRGNAAVVWWSHGSFDDGVHYRPYKADVGWEDSSHIAFAMTGEVSNPRIAMNGEGDALCIFRHYDDRYKLRGTDLDSDGEWTSSVLISEDILGHVSLFALSINEDGSGLAVWDHSDGIRTNMWSAEYLAQDETPPPVTIESPEDGSIVDAFLVTVMGVTEPGAYLTVNGLTVAVDDDGSYECSIVLVEGENVITAIAVDGAGNSASTSVTVTYEVPEDTLQEELSDLHQELNETKAELNETIADLDEANAELDDVMDQLEEAGESLDDAESRIDSLATQMMALMALTAVFVILSIVMTALYFSLKKTLGSSEKKPDEPEVPPPPE